MDMIPCPSTVGASQKLVRHCMVAKCHSWESRKIWVVVACHTQMRKCQRQPNSRSTNEAGSPLDCETFQACSQVAACESLQVLLLCWHRKVMEE
jgi:hypothetical protein